jgi:ergothioneine biosynthesis protein EgtB
LPVDRNASASLTSDFRRVREQSVQLCANLSPEDMVVQSMPDTSPTKWHLAHITWFFERFVLEEYSGSYRRFNDDFDYLFNSYYYSVGQMHARPRRGLLSRPSFDEVLEYRRHVDAGMQELLEQNDDSEVVERVILGLNHEQQHQELLLTDIKHVLSCNPTLPAMHPDLVLPTPVLAGEYTYSKGRSGIRQIGARGMGFCFDNELPRHEALLHEHELGDRLVTNGEYREFIEDGGYRDSNLWLSDGWAARNGDNRN